MPISFKASMLLVAALSLTACLDSKSGDKKTALAIQEQTKTLQQQADQNKPIVSLTGFIKNLNTDTKASNATVKIKIGANFSDPVAVNDSGVFQFDNLAPSSAFELVVHSATGAFLDRTVFGTTNASTSGKAFQDLGIIGVAAGVEHHFKILDNDTNAPITNLVLHASSNIGTGINEEKYFFTSTYDASIQSYKITVPDLLVDNISASLDVDHDGKNEYVIVDEAYNYGGNLMITRDKINNTNNIYLIDLHSHEKTKIKITVLDEAGKNITGVVPSINDALNGYLAATFDTSNNQYVFDALSSDDLNIYIPSAKIQGKIYDSAAINIHKNSNLNYWINANGIIRNYSFAAPGDKVFDVVVSINEQAPSTPTSVALSPFLSTGDVMKVFYTTPVVLKTDTVSLTRSTIKVTKGDASTTDSVAAGSTQIDYYDEPIAVTGTLSLDGTLLSVTPAAPLPASYTYTYHVGTLSDTVLHNDVDVSGDDYTVTKLSADDFDINSIKLDNENYKTNDTPIIAANTAGVSTSSSYYSPGGYVAFYFPLSIENLQTLKIRILSVVSGSSVLTYNDLYTIVQNGYITGVYKTPAVATAINEYHYGSAYNVIYSSAQPDGQYYRWNLPSYVYLYDNTASSVNTVTFNYTYDTRDGTHQSGTLTVPVM